MAFNKSFETLAIGGIKHNSVLIFKRKPNLHIVKTFNNHKQPLTACKFIDDDDRTRLVTLSYDKRILDWDVETGKVIKKFSQSYTPLSVDALGLIIVVGYRNGDVRLISLSKQKEINSACKLHSSPVNEVKFVYDGFKIMSASSDDQIKIIDFKSMKIC